MILPRIVANSRLVLGWRESGTAFLFKQFLQWVGLLIGLIRKIMLRLEFLWQSSALNKYLRWLDDRRCLFFLKYPAHPGLLKLVDAISMIMIIAMPAVKDWGGLVFLLLVRLAVVPERLRLEKDDRLLLATIIMILSAIVFSGGLPVGLGEGLRILSGFCLALLVRRQFTPTDVEKIIKYLVGTSVIWMLIGFWQHGYGIRFPLGWLEPEQHGLIPGRISSVFGNPNIYAIYLVTIMALIAHLKMQAGQKRLRWVCGVIFSLALLSLYWTYARSGWIIGALLVGWLVWKKLRPNLLYPVIVVLTILFIAQAGDFSARISHWLGAAGTLSYRFRIWQGVCGAIPDQWLWGGGPGSFGRVYPWHQLGRTVATHAHQFYLQFWLEYGVLSLLGLCVILKRTFSIRLLPKMLAMALICFLGFGFSESWQVHPFIYGFFWLMIGFAGTYEKGIQVNG